MLLFTVFFSQYLDDFNMSSSKEMKLVFFMDAMRLYAGMSYSNINAL